MKDADEEAEGRKTLGYEDLYAQLFRLYISYCVYYMNVCERER